MVNEEDRNENPEYPENPRRQPEIAENGQKDESLFSPGFRSVAAMAGWDEEALLIASLIVEDTPDRQSKQKRRSGLQNVKTPPTNSRRKRRAQVRSPPVAAFNLDENESISKQETEKTNIDANINLTSEEAESKPGDNLKNVSGQSTAIPCIDRLREELSCAICLEICYEPSTTACGHSNGRYCTVNTVLWNTIQLLFPKEVDERKAAATAASSDGHKKPHKKEVISTILVSHNVSHRPVQALDNQRNESSVRERRNHRIRNRNLQASGLCPDEDSALALRLQREEYMEVFREPDGHSRRRSSLAKARANLRAMASRVVNYRTRDRTS